MTLKDGAEPKVGMRPFYATYGRQVCFVMPIVQLCLGAFLFILLRVVALKVAQRIKSEKPEVEAAMEATDAEEKLNIDKDGIEKDSSVDESMESSEAA